MNENESLIEKASGTLERALLRKKTLNKTWKMLHFSCDASQSLKDYMQDLERELSTFEVHAKAEYLKMWLFDIEMHIRFFSVQSALKRKSSQVEAADVEQALKTFGKPERCVRSLFRDVDNCLNSQKVTLENLSIMKQKLLQTRGPAVLDAGCGWGRISRKLRDYCHGKFEATGVDLDKPSLRFGKSVNEATNFVVSNVQALPFKDKMFDLIIGNSVLHEVKTITGRCIAVQEFSRVSKPAGMLNLTDAFAKLRVISVLTRILQHLPGTAEWIFRKSQLEKMLKKNGFRIIRTEKASSRFYGLVNVYTFTAIRMPSVANAKNV